MFVEYALSYSIFIDNWVLLRSFSLDSIEEHHTYSLLMIHIFIYLSVKFTKTVYRPDYTIYLLMTIFGINVIWGCFWSELDIFKQAFDDVYLFFKNDSFHNLDSKLTFQTISNFLISFQLFFKLYGCLSLNGQFLFYGGFLMIYKVVSDCIKKRDLKPILIVFIFWQVLVVLAHTLHHRYYSHHSFSMNRPTQFIFSLVGLLANHRGGLWWSSHHRTHHFHCDTSSDTHSPSQRGFYYSHVGWMFPIENFKIVFS
eukprot:UN34674